MVINVTIKGELLLALLDTGSTHNFIQGLRYDGWVFRCREATSFG
jgi:hypothetical protein